MSDPNDIFSNPPENQPNTKWEFVKKPWFIISVGAFFSICVVVFSMNQIMVRLLHARPEVSVPKIEGKNLVDAMKMVSDMDLSLQYESTDYDESLPAGTVIRQHPPSGMRVRTGRPIRVVVSKGGQASFVPDIAGRRLAEAQSLLAAEGIQLGSVTEVYSLDAAKGTVLSQTPSSGTVVARGALVDLDVSKGAPPSGLPIAPDLVGRSENDANQWAADAGVSVKVKFDSSGLGAPGAIIRQTPVPGQPVLEGQDLTIYVVPSTGGNVETLKFDVSSDFDEAVVRIVARDIRGESEIYENTHRPGEHVEIPVAVNATTRFRIYVNDVLQEEKVVEP